MTAMRPQAKSGARVGLTCPFLPIVSIFLFLVPVLFFFVEGGEIQILLIIF